MSSALVIGGALSIALAAAGLWIAVKAAAPMSRRVGLGVAAVGVILNPWFVSWSTGLSSVHAALVVGASLWVPLVVFQRMLRKAHDRIGERGRLSRLGLRFVWVFVALQDLLLFIGFQGVFVHAAFNSPLLLEAEILGEVAVGFVVVYLLSGDGRPSLGHIKQVFIAWSSSMVTMTLGVSLGLSGAWFAFFRQRALPVGLEVDQQIAAAILVVLGGAPWFILGAQKLGLWLDAEEREERGSLRAPTSRIGRSVRSGSVGGR